MEQMADGVPRLPDSLFHVFSVFWPDVKSWLTAFVADSFSRPLVVAQAASRVIPISLRQVFDFLTYGVDNTSVIVTASRLESNGVIGVSVHLRPLLRIFEPRKNRVIPLAFFVVLVLLVAGELI